MAFDLTRTFPVRKQTIRDNGSICFLTEDPVLGMEPFSRIVTAKVR
jgi:hypothetical protein